MPFDEGLAARVRAALPVAGAVEERKMFGGLAFLLNGRMACGILDQRLMVRVSPESYVDALREEHVKPMDFTGRVMRGFVYVEPPGIADREGLERWVERGLRFAATLPPK